MTQPITTIQLPAPTPGTPILARMVSNALFPEAEMRNVQCPHCTQRHQVSVGKNKQDEPIVWELNKPHPLLPDMLLVRMFVEDDGVEIYSVAKDGTGGLRNLVPMSTVRLIEELMTPRVLVDELTEAEEGNAESFEEDDEPDEEQGPEQTSDPEQPNGQVGP